MAAKMKTRAVVRAMKDPESLEPFLAIRTEREYDVAVAHLTALADEIGENPADPRFRLIETLTVLLQAYLREPPAEGEEVS